MRRRRKIVGIVCDLSSRLLGLGLKLLRVVIGDLGILSLVIRSLLFLSKILNCLEGILWNLGRNLLVWDILGFRNDVLAEDIFTWCKNVLVSYVVI